MSRKIEEAEQANPPLQSNLKSAREPNFCDRLLTPTEAANFLRLSLSWLAKARMRGDGPPFIKLRRASDNEDYLGDCGCQCLATPFSHCRSLNRGDLWREHASPCQRLAQSYRPANH